MRKITLLLHTSLDGFVAGPGGEMDWIKIDAEIFDLVGHLTDEADAALYGRVTYQMMESYWPTAGDQPNATKHDKEHASWYNKVNKIIFSKTLGSGIPKTTIISDNIFGQVTAIKQQPGKNILVIGSPSTAHSLMEHNLIDEYWLFINPVLLGEGIPLFANIKSKTNLKPLLTKPFSCGVTALQYSVER